MVSINVISVGGTAPGHSLNFILVFHPNSLTYKMLMLFLCLSCYGQAEKYYLFTDLQRIKSLFRLSSMFTGLQSIMKCSFFLSGVQWVDIDCLLDSHPATLSSCQRDIWGNKMEIVKDRHKGREIADSNYTDKTDPI